ncbi:PH domain-containing protein [Methanolobus psychrotolerans]|uniref:PH domain-containing protein n=1 Tax=Methanolobus psychrotolerans TaxID=1874706 RepID=UPI000B91C7D7|nr:PH domain-containing protein [Methanolobus psychrotolerans]
MLENAPSEHIDPRALKAWFITGILEGFVLLLIPISYLVLDRYFWDLPVIWGRVGIAVVAIYVIWEALIAPQLRMRFWRYEIRENEIDIQRGIFIIRRTLIPMGRVQHVDTEYGPVMRYFGLATLRVSTAATDHSIPALSKEKASELMGEIASLARVSDEDV